MSNEIEVTVVDAPPHSAAGRGRGDWADRLTEARKAAPKWVRIGPFQGPSALSVAKAAASKAPGTYEITTRKEDGEVWVYLRALSTPKAVAS